MELKNIHNRSDFKKTYEFFGNTEGGVGSKDGFANNAKMKDTVLGKLFNGIFKGIGWLWRKSKETFIISKLIGQLVNELMRGVVLYCFDNNISLRDGTRGEAEESEEDEAPVQDEASTQDEAPVQVSDLDNLTDEELQERIERLTAEIKVDEKSISDLEGQIRYMQGSAHNGTIGEKKRKEEHLIKLEEKLKRQKEGLQISKEELVKLHQRLRGEKPVEKPVEKPIEKSTLDTLASECKKKYNFVPKSSFLPEDPADFDEIGHTSLPDFKEQLRGKQFKSKCIQIGDPFRIVGANGVIENIKVYDVNNSTGQVWYFTKAGGNKIFETTNIKLLPEDFPGFKKIKSLCVDYLSKYVPEYSSMSDENKEKIETIYMQYRLIDELSNVRKTALVEESLAYLMYLNQYELLTEAIKIKPSNPKAGQVGVARNIATKVPGIQANIGDLLTKKDKDKYSEQKEDLSISIRDIDLANIEKTIEKIDKEEPGVKQRVTSYVNPYNLKTIQLSAEQLISKAPEANRAALKLKWDKEQTKVYASFTGMMDMEKISKDNLSNLDSGKLGTKTEKMTKDINNQMTEAKTMNELPLETKRLNYNRLRTGFWSYFSFLYPSTDDTLYKTTVAPVNSAFKDFGLICVTSSFESYDPNEKTIINNNNFDKLFMSNSSDETSTKYKVNVFFLFKNEQKFPDSNKSYPMKMFVLNEFINDGVSYISLKRIKGTKNTAITKSFVNNLNKNEYMFNVSTTNMYKFVDEIGDIAETFNFVRSDEPSKNTDFRAGHPQPLFLTDGASGSSGDEMRDYLKKLSKLL